MKGLFGSFFDFGNSDRSSTSKDLMDFVRFPKTSTGDDDLSLEERLDRAGVDAVNLDNMDDQERWDALEDAGVNPYDFGGF
ncbi:hypothetical protein K6V98_01785 [Collinsella sp. AGMB00827]|uniref:Uncharacterized protein n=1 Tax=Collinsella ureilytica TaxID=2869515 RepID=A0ABS7MJ31_9ACTN|nr:hypothetical protein [Collinsella urealyticum]MBY4797095.1 hypothetical protein [Collinsella urealyticum]